MLHPIKNNVVIKVFSEQEKPNSSITGFITEVKDKKDKGEIIAAGKDVEEVQKGEKVYFNNIGREVMHKGDKYIITPEDNILAIIR